MLTQLTFGGIAQDITWICWSRSRGGHEDLRVPTWWLVFQLAGGRRKALASWHDIEVAFMQTVPQEIKISGLFQFIATQRKEKE